MPEYLTKADPCLPFLVAVDRRLCRNFHKRQRYHQYARNAVNSVRERLIEHSTLIDADVLNDLFEARAIFFGIVRSNSFFVMRTIDTILASAGEGAGTVREKNERIIRALDDVDAVLHHIGIKAEVLAGWTSLKPHVMMQNLARSAIKVEAYRGEWRVSESEQSTFGGTFGGQTANANVCVSRTKAVERNAQTWYENVVEASKKDLIHCTNQGIVLSVFVKVAPTRGRTSAWIEAYKNRLFDPYLTIFFTEQEADEAKRNYKPPSPETPPIPTNPTFQIVTTVPQQIATTAVQPAQTITVTREPVSPRACPAATLSSYAPRLASAVSQVAFAENEIFYGPSGTSSAASQSETESIETLFSQN